MKAILTGFLALMLMASAAIAAPVLTIDDSWGEILEISDNGAGDFNPAVGIIETSPYGDGSNWYITAIVGSSLSPLPTLSLTATVSSNWDGVIDVSLTDNGFVTPLDGFTTVATGYILDVPGSGIEINSYYDGVTVGSFAFGTGAFGDTAINLDAPADGYSVTLNATVTHADAGDSYFDIQLNPIATPEPGTMLLLGSGILGLAIFGSRRKK